MSDAGLFDDEPDGPASTGSARDDARRHGHGDDGGVQAGTPLAERMRPRALDDIVGQEAILAPGAPLRLAIENDVLQSLDPLGSSGHRQDDACASHRPSDARDVRAVQRGAVGYQGDP